MSRLQFYLLLVVTFNCVTSYSSFKIQGDFKVLYTAISTYNKIDKHKQRPSVGFIMFYNYKSYIPQGMFEEVNLINQISHLFYNHDKNLSKSDRKPQINTQNKHESEKALKRIVVISVVALSLQSLIIAIILVKIKRFYTSKLRHNSDHYTEEISLEFERLKVDMEQMKNFVLAKNKSLEKCRHQLAQIENQQNQEQNKYNPDLEPSNILKNRLLTEEDWLQFRRAFENSHVNFINKLLIRLPGLTQAELRYLLLRKLGFSRTEIAKTLGISPDSVRQYRHRIHKKFNFNSNEELDKILV